MARSPAREMGFALIRTYVRSSGHQAMFSRKAPGPFDGSCGDPLLGRRGSPEFADLVGRCQRAGDGLVAGHDGNRRRGTAAGTSIELPAFKDSGGTWRPAIRPPPKRRTPLADAVTAYLLETGLAGPRFGGANS